MGHRGIEITDDLDLLLDVLPGNRDGEVLGLWREGNDRGTIST